MKTISIAFTSLALAAVFCSCGKMDIDNPPSPVDGNGSCPPVFTVSINREIETKVGMTPAGDVFKLHWEDTDTIAIHSTLGNVEAWSEYVAVPDESVPSFATLRFVGGDEPVEGATAYDAYYPSSIVTENGTLSLPEKYGFVPGGADVLPMYAESSTTSFSFRNLCSLLRFTVSTEDTDVRIVNASLSRSSSGSLCGPCEITGTDEEPVLAPLSTGKTDVGMTVPDIDISEESLSVIFPLFPGDYAGEELALHLKTQSGAVRDLILRKKFTAERGTVHSFDLDVDFWEPIGSGTYRDSYVLGPVYQYDTDFEQFVGSDCDFRVSSVYAPGQYIYLSIDPETDVVSYPDFYTYYSSSYEEDVMAYHPSRFVSMASDPSYWMKNIVLSYQVNGLPGIVQLAPYYYMSGLGGWDKTQNDDIIRLAFPGAKLVNEYYNIFISSIDTDENGTAYVILRTSLGNDIKAIASFTPLSGTGNEVEMEGECDEYVTFVLGKNLPAGQYEINVIVKNKNTNETLDDFSLPFNYTDLVNFEVVCSGEYDFGSAFFRGYSDDVVIYRSKTDDTRYVLKNPELSAPIAFTLNEDNSICVDIDQFIYNDSNYGHILVGEWYKCCGSDIPEDSSYYDPETGIYHFHLMYYCQNGQFGDCWEFLTPYQQG